MSWYETDSPIGRLLLAGDARALHLLVRGDLGFLQRLNAADFELLDHTPTLQSRRFQRLLLRHFGGLDLAAGDDFGLLDLPVGVDALRTFRR